MKYRLNTSLLGLLYNQFIEFFLYYMGAFLCLWATHYIQSELPKFAKTDESLKLWNGKAEDLDQEIKRYTRLIEETPLTIALLGVGENGHVAFNEPDASDEDLQKTRVVELTENTREVNNTSYEKAITVGFETILSAEKVFVIISGQYKRDVIKSLFDSKVTNPLKKLLSQSSFGQIELCIDGVCLTRETRYKIERCLLTQNKLLQITPTANITVLVPHPDDEIFGMGAYLNYLFTNHYNVTIVYMTDGSGGGDPEIRKKEAVKAVETLGGSEANIRFTNSFPFYTNESRKVGGTDILLAKCFFENSKIDVLFVCGDLHDPSGTHRKCYDIIVETMKYSRMSLIEVYEYTAGIWGEPTEEFDVVFPFSQTIMDRKMEAMKNHVSQLEPPNGRSKIPFYERTENFNKIKNHPSLSFVGVDYVEGFFRIK